MNNIYNERKREETNLYPIDIRLSIYSTVKSLDAVERSNARSYYEKISPFIEKYFSGKRNRNTLAKYN